MAARLGDIRRAAQVFGIEVLEPSSGSHWKAKKEEFRTYPIPAHNGLRSEVSDVYVSAFCKHFKIDEIEFRTHL